MRREEFQETIPVPDWRAEILTTVDRAEASVGKGEGRAITQESMRRLAQEVKQRGRSRLAAGQSSPI